MIDKIINVLDDFAQKSYKGDGYYNFLSEDIGISIYSKKYDELNKKYPAIYILPYYHYTIYAFKGYNKIRVKDENCEYNCIEEMNIKDIDRIKVYRETEDILYDSNL